jgi:hypothetical protein
MIEMMLAIQSAAQDALAGKPTNVEELLAAADALSPDDREILAASRANPKSWVALATEGVRMTREIHANYLAQKNREEPKQIEQIEQLQLPMSLLT